MEAVRGWVWIFSGIAHYLPTVTYLSVLQRLFTLDTNWVYLAVIQTELISCCYNGNTTEWSPFWSRSRSSIITSMITDRIGRQKVLSCI